MNTINSLSTNLGLNIHSFVDDPETDGDAEKKIKASNDYFYEVIDDVKWNTEDSYDMLQEPSDSNTVYSVPNTFDAKSGFQRLGIGGEILSSPAITAQWLPRPSYNWKDQIPHHPLAQNSLPHDEQSEVFKPLFRRGNNDKELYGDENDQHQIFNLSDDMKLDSIGKISLWCFFLS